MTHYKNKSFLQISPLLVFVSLFLMATTFKGFAISPLFACIVAIMYSFFTFTKKMKLNEKVALFVEGCADTTVLSMIYIFIFSAVFTYILKLIGGIDSAVAIGLYLLPSQLLLPGFFTVIGIFATAIGSSMGTIAAFLPVGVGIASSLHINPSLIAGVVVSGAMLGDNLSIISDTTIAAIQTTHSSMKAKFKENLWFVVPAFIITFVALWIVNAGVVEAQEQLFVSTVTATDFIRVIPYLLVFVLALCGLDVIAVLITGILASIAIGMGFGAFTFVEGTQFFLKGFSADVDIQATLILSLLVAGLAHIVRFNGGLSYVLDRVSARVKSSIGAQFAISGLIVIVNAAVAINTVAILIVGPLAHSLAQGFGIRSERCAVLLDMFSCFCQGILPYAPQLLLASALADVSSVSIMPYLYYQGSILLVALAILSFEQLRSRKASIRG